MAFTNESSKCDLRPLMSVHLYNITQLTLSQSLQMYYSLCEQIIKFGSPSVNPAKNFLLS